MSITFSNLSYSFSSVQSEMAMETGYILLEFWRPRARALDALCSVLVGIQDTVE